MDTQSAFRQLTLGIRFKKPKIGQENSQASSSFSSLKSENEFKEESDFDETDVTTPRMKREVDDEDDSSIQLMSKQKGMVPKVKKKNPLDLKKEAELKQEMINRVRNKHKIRVYGGDIPPPIEEFSELAERFKIAPQLMKNLQDMGYETPSPIQMQAIPLMIQRREILACAPTGSGKTVAFVLPILHLLEKPADRGFRAVIVSPTRELAQQTWRECIRLSEGTKLKTHLITNVNKAMKKFGPSSDGKFDVLVTTPNRLLYMLKQDPPGVSLKNVEWLVVDEADKLFEEGPKGFRDQLATIYKACDKSGIKRAFFSATVAYEVEQFCKLELDNLATVSVGPKNSATDMVDQRLVFVGNDAGKLVAFRNLIREGLEPPVLVFVQSKERAKELFNELIYDGINVDVIHAERPQIERENVVRNFRLCKIWVLICTELMGRGIDFKGVNLVVNYDFPPSAISYIHRIGRTGRAGRRGKAVTYFTENDSVNLRSIAQIMQDSGCEVPDYMLQMRKPSKRQKKELLTRPPKRQRISTQPLSDGKKKRKFKKKTPKAPKPAKMENENESS